ncbi:hypothetical protein OG592_37045 [Streptomyces avidinii]|nr:hypothetical protein OG592_37045 [Streptomyces avidinii]
MTTSHLADGTVVAVTAGIDGELRVWSLPDGRLRFGLRGHTRSVTALATTRLPDGRTAAVSVGDGAAVMLWDLNLGRSIGQPIRLPEPVTALTVAPSGLVTGYGPELT